MEEGSRMWAISLLTITLVLPLLSAAPVELGGDSKDDNDGVRSHDENVTRAGKFFGHNRFDVGNINISGSVEGDDVSIGHQVNIDVQGQTHDNPNHEDDTVIVCKEGLRVLFKSIDSNKNGLMDAKELLRVCHQNNLHITESLAVKTLTLPDKTVGFNMDKFCELLKDCPSTNSADLIYFLLQLFDKVEEKREFSPPRPQPKVCMKEDNYDYWGNDIENKQTTGQEECANWCGAHNECNAWTLRKNDNWCWIKTSDAGRSKDNLRISGTKGCAVCMKEDNYDYWGNDIENKETTGQEECANWCGAHKECNAWTLSKSDNTCWIKTSDAGRSKDNLRISGTKGCVELKLDASDVPYLRIGSKWMPICGHYFWDNNNGADIVCRNLGYSQGGVVERVEGLYSEDAYYVGRCDSSVTDLENDCTKEPLPESECKKGNPVSIKVNCCKKENYYDYLGNDIDNRWTTGQEDCANWCRAHKECKYWTLEKTDNRCWIKTSDAGRSKDNLYISGTKGCGTGKVSCGNHRASSCYECPQGHGETWCNGECSWTGTKCIVGGCSRDELDNICSCNRDYNPVCAGGILYNNLCLYECAKKETECATNQGFPNVGDIGECVPPGFF